MTPDDWQPMETAPLNPYGEAFGPTVLIWCSATGTPLPAYYEPRHGWEHRDTGPAWIVDDGAGDAPIAPEDAVAWMPIDPPRGQTGSHGVRMGQADPSLRDGLSREQRWFAALTQDREELVGILRDLLAGDATGEGEPWRSAMQRARQFIKTEDDDT